VIITPRGQGSVMARRTVSPMTTVLHLAERLVLADRVDLRVRSLRRLLLM
jgi:hypothetical protein